MARKKIKIYCENNNIEKIYKLGTSLNEIIEDQQVKLEYPILGAMVNNELAELTYEIYKPKTIKFIDITHDDGMRMYVRSLSFVLQTAVNELYPKSLLRIEHSISNGLYCELDCKEKKLDIDRVFKIGGRMREIIEADFPFKRKEVRTEKAIKIFMRNNYVEKAKLFKNRKQLYTSIYSLGNRDDYYYGMLVPSTGYLKVFDLVKYYDGMLLQKPKSKNPSEVEELILQPKMFDIIREYEHWGKILQINTIGSINEAIEKGNANELIKISEALHEKKVSHIADEIKKREKTRLVLISGPSSSGKTTFSKRLAIHLKVIGLKPIQISLDNYFVDRDKTPKDENGEYDFESLQAIDIKLFNENLLDLMAGKKIKIPKFSFDKGKRYFNGEECQISNDHIIIVEGIHGLNPGLTPHIPKELKFKVYVSALTQVGIDHHNRIPTTDNRLLRRIIRDKQYRNYSAEQTIKRWPSVRRGEDKNIFPYQENADTMFNSALPFELGVIKQYIEPVLKEVYQNVPEYAEAKRLLKFLSWFVPVPDKDIPPTSILREFLHGSSFKY